MKPRIITPGPCVSRRFSSCLLQAKAYERKRVRFIRVSGNGMISQYAVFSFMYMHRCMFKILTPKPDGWFPENLFEPCDWNGFNLFRVLIQCVCYVVHSCMRRRSPQLSIKVSGNSHAQQNPAAASIFSFPS